MRSAAVLAGCAWVLALAPGTASASDSPPLAPATPSPRSAILERSSGPLVKPIEQAKADRVRRVLDLSLGDGGSYYLSGRQLRVMLGGPFRLNGSGEALETVEIRAPQEVREPPHGAPIPFGLAGIVWGARHPTQAWRLIMPVVD